MSFFNLFKKKVNLTSTGKIHIPLFEVEPIDFLKDAVQINDEYGKNKFIDYEYSSKAVHAGLFDTFTFKVFSESRDFEPSMTPQINLSARIQQPSIQTIGSAEVFVNTMNKVLNDNDPFTDVDMNRITEGVWRGRSYFINSKGIVDKSASVGSYLLEFQLDNKKFDLSLIGYNYFSLKT